MNRTEWILNEIGHESSTLDDVAFAYALLLEEGRFDFTEINVAIVRRWHSSGLKRIKEQAWATLFRPKSQFEKWRRGKQAESRLSYWRKRRERFKAIGLCGDCGKLPVKDGRSRCQPCISRRNRTQTRATRQENQNVRDQTFQHYGGYLCACCGETEQSMLTIDHINEDGGAHRKSIRTGSGRVGGITFYRWLRTRSFPSGYQVLCWNCNIGKHRNGGSCPHKKAA